MSLRSLASFALLAAVAVAKTDLTGCTSSDSVVTPSNGGTPYATRVWYVPDTGEVCAALDCGGGRAPPKTTVPGCPQYSGTDTYSPSFLPVKTTSAAAATDKTIKASATATTAAPSTTGSVTGKADSSSSSSSSASGSDSVQADTQTGTLATVTGSAAGNGTVATATSKAGGQGTKSGGASGTRATGSPSSSVPNAAAPAGAAREMFGLVAGVALGAAVLL